MPGARPCSGAQALWRNTVAAPSFGGGTPQRAARGTGVLAGGHAHQGRGAWVEGGAYRGRQLRDMAGRRAGSGRPAAVLTQFADFLYPVSTLNEL